MAEQADGPAVPIPAVDFNCEADQVHLLDLAPYIENTTRWTPWLRTVLGLREEYYWASDHSDNLRLLGVAQPEPVAAEGQHRLRAVLQDRALCQRRPGLPFRRRARRVRHRAAGRLPGCGGRDPAPGLHPPARRSGLRTDIVPRLSIQVAVFREDFRSELAYNADAGEDEALRAEPPQGIEVSAQYHPTPWLELNTDLAFSKARYPGRPDGLRPGRPLYRQRPELHRLVRRPGRQPRPLVRRAAVAQARRLSDQRRRPPAQDKGYSEVNLDVGYKVNRGLKLQVSVFNLFNTRANAAAFYYARPACPASRPRAWRTTRSTRWSRSRRGSR
ncbi:MAG: hypothetical protein WDM92_16395 [Caulobacteraceae bacterium]